MRVSLTPDQASAYYRFMSRNETKNIATFALGTLQSETAPVGLQQLYAFAGTPGSLFVLVRSPRTARQLDQALSGSGG